LVDRADVGFGLVGTHLDTELGSNHEQPPARY
jgi:hypothetical protein